MIETVTKSRGWRTEAILVVLGLLILAGVGDVATMVGLESLKGTSAELLKLGMAVAAGMTARARSNR